MTKGINSFVLANKPMTDCIQRDALMPDSPHSREQAHQTPYPGQHMLASCSLTPGVLRMTWRGLLGSATPPPCCPAASPLTGTQQQLLQSLQPHSVAAMWVAVAGPAFSGVWIRPLLQLCTLVACVAWCASH